MGPYSDGGRRQSDDTKFRDAKPIYCKADSQSLRNVFRYHEPDGEGALHRGAADTEARLFGSFKQPELCD